MTPDEFDLALRAVARLKPFRSFQIEFTSGDRLTVTHPEVLQRVGDLFAYQGPDNSGRILSAATVCQILIPPPRTPQASITTNGPTGIS